MSLPRFGVVGIIALGREVDLLGHGDIEMFDDAMSLDACTVFLYRPALYLYG